MNHQSQYILKHHTATLRTEITRLTNICPAHSPDGYEALEMSRELVEWDNNKFKVSAAKNYEGSSNSTFLRIQITLAHQQLLSGVRASPTYLRFFSIAAVLIFPTRPPSPPDPRACRRPRHLASA